MDAIEVITKTKDGFTWDSGDFYLFLKHYDSSGVYLSQTQENILDDGPPFNFKAQIIDGKPCVNGKPVPPLTKEQMESAR